uniref:Zinc finger protein 385A n=1 Tax=Hucho hucho TaxID=62062 RepID=A0A4W5QLA3_9TELE
PSKPQELQPRPPFPLPPSHLPTPSGPAIQPRPSLCSLTSSLHLSSNVKPVYPQPSQPTIPPSSQAEAHYKGNRHARRVKGIETSKSRPQEGDKPAPPVPPSPSDPALTYRLYSNSILPIPALNTGCWVALVKPPTKRGGPVAPVAPGAPAGPETEEDKAKKLLYCSLCKVAVNSLSQLEAHNKGTKHKTILEARSGLGPIKAYPRLGPKLPGELGGGPLDPNTQERTFHCEICNVRVNSELQLKQHISSRRHRDGVAGKPNPLLSRHKKHRGADLTSSLTFSKDLSKCYGAGLLPSPLAVAAAMALRAAASSVHHPSHHHHHHLLQGPPLSHAILRPAPGPMRTSHGPILFSPY